MLGRATLLSLALFAVASLPEPAAAKYGSPQSRSVTAATRAGTTLSSPQRVARSVWSRGGPRPAADERVRPDEPRRGRELPFLAGRDLGLRNLVGTAVRSPVRSLATRTALLQRPLRDISARPALQWPAACRASAGQSHPLRAPPSSAL